MFSLALKNGIIMILIILILHFLIKNYLFDKKPQAPQLPQTFVENTPSTSVSTQVAAMSALLQSQPPLQPPIEPKKQDKSYEDDELLQYVKSLAEPQPKPDASSCEPVVTKLDPGYSSSALKTPRVVGDPSEKQSQYYLLNEYEDESVMNGGKMFANIDGFEEYDKFSLYEKV